MCFALTQRIRETPPRLPHSWSSPQSTQPQLIISDPFRWYHWPLHGRAAGSSSLKPDCFGSLPTVLQILAGNKARSADGSLQHCSREFPYCYHFPLSPGASAWLRFTSLSALLDWAPTPPSLTKTLNLFSYCRSGEVELEPFSGIRSYKLQVFRLAILGVSKTNLRDTYCICPSFRKVVSLGSWNLRGLKMWKAQCSKSSQLTNFYTYIWTGVPKATSILSIHTHTYIYVYIYTHTYSLPQTNQCICIRSCICTTALQRLLDSSSGIKVHTSKKIFISIEHNITVIQKRQNLDYLAGYFQFGWTPGKIFWKQGPVSSFLSSLLGCTCFQDSKLLVYVKSFLLPT